MSGYPKGPQQHESPEPQNDADIIGMLKRMQQQLVYLEKKIDSLIAQRPGQGGDRPPFRREGGFQKPFRPYGRPQHSRNGPDSGHRPSYGGHRPEGGPSNGPGGGRPPFKKKPFYGKRDR